jgi:hypothetical protein
MSMSLNFSCERKGVMKSLVASIGLAMVLATPAFAAVDWGFDNSSNPYNANQGLGTATIGVGAFGSGWHDGTTVPWASFGATGFWDLGRAGTIRLAGLSNSGSLSLQVVQWVNNGTFSGNLAYEIIRGGSQYASGVLSSPGGSGSGWEQWGANFNLASGDQVMIIAPNGGALIDRVMLSVVPEPATMLAGAMLLVPFGLSTWHALKRKKSSGGRS